MPYILSLDQGTTSSRAIIFDSNSNIIALAQKEYRQIYPRDGWVEHNPNDIWQSQRDVIIEVLAKTKLTTKNLTAIGITNQRETTIIWDRKTGEPIGNAIVWQDRRTENICQNLIAQGLEKIFTEKTGLLLDPYFSGSKIYWMLEHIDGARSKAERGELAFGTVDSWLVWKLTSGALHITDASNASRTLLFNINRGEWDTELLKIFNIPHSLLPTVHSSSEVYGVVNCMPELNGVPIAGIAGDQHAALFGQACMQPGMAKNTYGTGCFMLMHCGDKPMASKNKLLSTIAWKIGDKTEYALEGSIFMGGAIVQWLRDNVGIIKNAADIETLAATVNSSAGVVLVPAFVGLGAPHWDPRARGMLIGITRNTNAAHIARAALEAIVLQVADVLLAMQKDAGIVLTELRVDGGACVNNLLMQLQADVLQTSVIRPKITETTALGAAYLAGLAIGFWPDRKVIQQQWSTERMFEPDINTQQLESLKQQWWKAIDRAKAWVET